MTFAMTHLDVIDRNAMTNFTKMFFKFVNLVLESANLLLPWLTRLWTIGLKLGMETSIDAIIHLVIAGKIWSWSSNLTKRFRKSFHDHLKINPQSRMMFIYFDFIAEIFEQGAIYWRVTKRALGCWSVLLFGDFCWCLTTFPNLCLALIYE